QGTAHLRTGTSVDFFGNGIAKTTFGCVDGCTSPVAEEAITSFALPGRPTGDRGGWLWRIVESYTTGTITSGRRHRQFVAYNAFGDPTDTTTELSGTQLIDRTNDAGKASAPIPSTAHDPATEPTNILVSHSEYDDFGNVKFQSGPNGRCRLVGHE